MKRVSIICRLSSFSSKYQVFSSKYLVLGIVLFLGSCEENSKSITDITPQIIQDVSNYSELNFERNTIIRAMFPIQYIGKNTGVITLNKVDSLQTLGVDEQKNTYSSYLISRTDLMSYTDTLSPYIVNAPTRTKNDSLNIIVDTTQIFETQFMELNNETLEKRISINKCYPIVIENLSPIDTIYFNENLSVGIQYYSEKTKQWELLEIGHGRCKVYNMIKLYPKNIMLLPVRIYAGELKIKCRVFFKNRYSKEFFMSANKEVLIK